MIGDRFFFYKEGGMAGWIISMLLLPGRKWRYGNENGEKYYIDYLEIKNTRVNISPADRFQMAWLNDQSNKIEEIIINWIWKRKYSSY